MEGEGAEIDRIFMIIVPQVSVLIGLAGMMPHQGIAQQGLHGSGDKRSKAILFKGVKVGLHHRDDFRGGVGAKERPVNLLGMAP